MLAYKELTIKNYFIVGFHVTVGEEEEYCVITKPAVYTIPWNGQTSNWGTAQKSQAY